MPDIFHTFFGICGLLLLGFFDSNERNLREIMVQVDPTYALPRHIVQKLKLPSQTLPIVTPFPSDQAAENQS